MKLGRRIALVLVALLVLAPTAARAATPEVDFDLNGDGKIDFRIFDTDGDGYYEWPSGSTTWKFDAVIPVPIVMQGSVSITAGGTPQRPQAIVFRQQVVTLPGAPLTKLLLNAPWDGVYSLAGMDITSTGDIVFNASNVDLEGPTSMTARRNIDVLSPATSLLGGSIYLADYSGGPPTYRFTAGKHEDGDAGTDVRVRSRRRKHREQIDEEAFPSERARKGHCWRVPQGTGRTWCITPPVSDPVGCSPPAQSPLPACWRSTPRSRRW